ncbi:hypothetical protein DTO027B5_7342 [Paecilomyces variotii]|nr:hypothetical protein DTO195F2_8492 [Paecilomyces variotii]KAJ9305436.1 hypothetical protein DTO217A2_5076 [Paecilomyces variotii]KAJ9324533.1 hypothetical protein DTO027B3_4551 [Paecilomyces variotii]KAJ9330915.1 hypothetical protein DTO027B5_7342 [Paecilomyces variotii]KAJ9370595.1 hypothetical protein DTO282E5_4763 [Paecilomyces variotii]
MHGTRVKHARDALKKLEPGSVRGSELDETKKKFAVPLGCHVKKKPTQEQFDLAASVKIRNTNVFTLEIVTPWTITAKAAKKKNSRTQTILGSSLVKNDSPSRKRSFEDIDSQKYYILQYGF